ncbi:hypothetical protein [Paenibacillus faecalis]|uniref:hypothetical protein n=1 Tax=Paenibacillus faecalis TaxID=2079532 RepID=UPI000D0E7E36|nr:hypothetical protein [Paenibacillus faecalis]
MKTKPKIILISITFIIVLSIAGLMYFSQGKASFNEIVTEKISLTDVSQIKISRLSYETLETEEIVVKEPDEINSIMTILNAMELKKTKTLDIQRDEYTYELIIKENLENKFGISFFDKNTLEIFDDTKTKNKISRYEIENDYNIYEELQTFFVE